MNEIKIENAYPMAYKATVINAIEQYWAENEIFNCIGSPKKQHIMLFLMHCGAIYTLKDGTELYAPPGSVVYAAEGSEYKVRFTKHNTQSKYNCIGINFKLFDENNVPFCFNRNVQVYALIHAAPVAEKFREIAEYAQHAVCAPMKMNGLFYILLAEIGSAYHAKHNILSKYKVIANGIHALENTSVNDIKINELAKLCNVSTIYFRKLFKEYAGVSPMEYKLNALLAQAKQQLLYSDKPIGEIAENLGFSSATYFCRIFKKKTGLTPMQYIKKEN